MLSILIFKLFYEENKRIVRINNCINQKNQEVTILSVKINQ